MFLRFFYARSGMHLYLLVGCVVFVVGYHFADVLNWEIPPWKVYWSLIK